MSRLLYGIEFALNDLLGVSILNNPLELFGLIVILALEVVLVILFYRSLKSYRETENFGTLLWCIAFILLFIGVLFLIFEKVAYSVLGNLGLGDLMGILALFLTALAIICFDIFSFHTAYPDYEKILSIIVTALAVIYLGSLSYAIASGSPNSEVINYELVYAPIFNIIVYLTLIPNLLIAPLVFFNYYSINRDKNRAMALRGLWMGISLLLFAIGYISEAAPYFPTVLSSPLRILHLISASIMYICLTMPDWFKNRIGWTE